jgi:NADH-quinone oxidoreductase subunit H
MILLFLKILLIIILILISVAFFTLAERKILAATQRRRGPNVIGLYGILQPLSDGLKLLTKESIFPSSSDKFLFELAPILTFLISLIGWVIIPFGSNSFIAELNLSSLYILACSSLGVYGILIAGWSSNSKYAFLGSMRSTAQMVSYEIPIGLIFSTIAILVGSFNLNEFIELQSKIGWLVFWFPFLFIVFFICGVAETNRHPFDLPEAEAELVSGYNVEYAAMGFALFSLGEYSNILMMSSCCTILFWGGWLAPIHELNFIAGPFWFGLKIIVFIFLFVLLRAGLPRYRYDQLMEIGWQILLILTLSLYVCFYTILWIFNGLPL